MKTFSCGCKFETDDAGKVIFNPDIIEAGEAQKHRRVV